MELRVHGIGAPDPARVLGCGSNKASVVSWRSEPGARSVVRACAGRRDVHVYHWSPLTSGSRSFAVWPLLLPFTVVNVAGYMAPPGRATWRTTVHRVAAVWVGLATTAAAMAWFLIAAMTVCQEVNDYPGRAPGTLSGREFAGAAALAAVTMIALVLTATFTASGFERYRPERWSPNPRPWRWPWGAGATARLDDPQFHDNGNDHAARWRIHVAVAALTWLATVWLVIEGGTDRAGHHVGRVLIAVGFLQGTGVVLMTVVALFPARDDRRRLTRRLLAPATATLGILMLGGLVLSGLIALTGIDEVPPGPLSALYDCYGWAVLGGIGGAAACVVHSLLSPVPAERGRARELVPTLGARMRARLATVLSSIDRVVTALALAFVASGAVALAFRGNEMLDDAWRLTATPPVNIARSTFAFVLAFTVLNLVKSRASPKVLRRIGNVWDILTFWPRAFHPFAVRPYAERAVPELQEFMRSAPRNDGLVIAAHSQGSVLAYAAVLPFVTDEGDCTLPPFALVTFGSPLRALYSAVFPHYFDSDELERVRVALGDRWVNHFRVTDHVGRALFASDAVVAAAHGQGSPGTDRPVADAKGLEGNVLGHNDYWTDPDIRAAIAQMHARLGELTPA
jgi:hypothetical protein